MQRLLAVSALAAFASVAGAQQPAPAPSAPAPSAAAQSAPAPSASAVAPHKCQKPDEFPGRLASDSARRNWTKTANGYLDCLKKYISDQQASYNALVDRAKPHLDAANASIDEYNKTVAAFKAQQGDGN